MWIDKRTLALSMRSSCWFNPFAMFAFCKMFNSEQQERLQFRELYEGEIGYFYMNKKTTVRNLINYQFYICIMFIRNVWNNKINWLFLYVILFLGTLNEQFSYPQ